jgi:RNA polymerase sigma-70 factor (ECF subfamily)
MREKTDPDIELVKRIQSDPSEDSFGLLYDRYSGKVYNFCLNYLGNEEDAKDCTQEIFIKVFRSIRGFRFGSSFYTWLYRIMINSCNDSVRKKMKNRTINEPGELLTAKSKEEDIPSLITNEQAMEAFYRALNKMKQKAKSILILRDIEGRSYEEISGILGCKPGTVRSRLARARISMAEQLKDFRDEM